MVISKVYYFFYMYYLLFFCKEELSSLTCLPFFSYCGLKDYF